MTTDTTNEDGEPTDTDIPLLVDEAQDIDAALRGHFKATEATVDTEHDGAATLRLEFRGFRDFASAMEKIHDVAGRLNGLPECDSVNCGVNTEGTYDPAADEHDDRPFGWVNATLGGDA